MTHHQRIYDYMSRFGSISPMEAYNHLGETKLSTRIGEMRRRGIEIEGREEVGKNRFGQEVRYMRYRLADVSKNRTDAQRSGIGEGRQTGEADAEPVSLRGCGAERARSNVAGSVIV